MSKFLMAFILSLLVSCASIHSGKYAKQIDEKGNIRKENITNSGIIVSGSEVQSMASKYFTQLDFTFENTTSEWIKVDSVNISFENKELDKLVKVPLATKLGLWALAAKQNKAIADYNKSMVIAGISAVGAVAGALSKSSGQRMASLGVFSASATALTYYDIKRSLNSRELSKVVPSSHLLNMPSYIPPGLHTKKWITIYLKDPYNSPYLGQVKVSYRVNGKKKESVLLPLRGEDTSSEFQNRYQAYWRKIKREEEIQRFNKKREEQRNWKKNKKKDSKKKN